MKSYVFISVGTGNAVQSFSEELFLHLSSDEEDGATSSSERTPTRKQNQVFNGNDAQVIRELFRDVLYNPMKYKHPFRVVKERMTHEACDNIRKGRSQDIRNRSDRQIQIAAKHHLIAKIKSILKKRKNW